MYSMMSYDKRLNKILKRRVNNLRILSKLLMLAPFLECLILTGSMARGDAGEDSDIDLMFIVKPGRIYTARFFVSAILYITGLKRGSKALTAHGKFCPNYYTTSEYLLTPIGRGEEMDRYCAENYSKSVFLAGEEKVFWRFLEKNDRNWKQYVNYSNYTLPRRQAGNYSNYSNPSRQGEAEVGSSKSQIHDTCYMIRDTFPVENSQSFEAIRSFSERILSGRFGDKLEDLLKRIQLAKINSDPRTKKYPDLIVANDGEIRAHPPKLNEFHTRTKHG
jgi:predicted nucleotidyltransferase